MQAQELYRQYRQRIETLADDRSNDQRWLTDLRAIITQFEQDVATLAPKSAAILCDDLCEQLEHEALCSKNRRREVLIGAVKSFEFVTIPDAWHDNRH